MALEKGLNTEPDGDAELGVGPAAEAEIGIEVLDSELKVAECDEHGTGPGTKVELTGRAPVPELRIVAYESVVDRDDAAQVSFTSKEMAQRLTICTRNNRNTAVVVCAYTTRRNHRYPKRRTSAHLVYLTVIPAMLIQSRQQHPKISKRNLASESQRMRRDLD